jgi:tetratricopeptide (TPR) repeat protein
MATIPTELVQSIQTGDCVLWAGAGFGGLSARPGWNELLSALVKECDASVHEQLSDLLEQGRLRTVLSYVHRHKGDGPLANLLKNVAEQSGNQAPGEGSANLARINWRAVFATTYADVIWQVFQQAGQSLDVFSHVDVHDLSLRKQKSAFILRTPPTGRSMRADRVFYELVEEVVRTRTILFLGFDIDDPDLFQILQLLDRVGRGRRHYAWLPYVTQAEAEELLEQYGIEVIHADEDQDLGKVFGDLHAATGATAPKPSEADDDLIALDLARLLNSIDVRADLAVDDALNCEVAEVQSLISALPGGNLNGVDPRTQLRAGSVLLAHGKLDEARRSFQNVISRGAGREYEAIARFNLALVAASEGDSGAAVEGLNSAAEAQRTLALVPPRFEITDVLARDGSRVMLSCRDRETNEELDIWVSTLGRQASGGEQRRFYDDTQRLVEVDHPSVKRHRGAFADGRLFGVMTEKDPGLPLEDMLVGSGGETSLDKAFESLGPLMDGIEACHERKILHRNITPSQILMTDRGAVLRGFGSPPVTTYNRTSVVRSNHGYAAPELLRGEPASPASDVYSLGAVLYRCITGLAPAGGAPAPSHVRGGIDPRVDEALELAMHPDPVQRPSPRSLRSQIATILTTPRPEPEVAAATPAAAPTAAVPQQADETLTPPRGLNIELPSDPNDLEGWTWILERKPNHMEARQAIERIEGEARNQGRWDQVAEVLNVRAQLSQAQTDRLELLRELAGIFENQLGAPGNAFETLQAVFEDLSVSAQVGLMDDLMRLGELTGRWSELAERLAIVANKATDDAERARLGLSLGRIYATELAAPDQAIACYEAVAEFRPEDADVQRALLDLYRRADRKAELATTLLSLAELETGTAKSDALIEASEILASELGETEGALDTVEAVLADDPENERALAVAEDLARELERWPTVASALARRADAAFDDKEANELRKEAAKVFLEKLQDENAALEQYRKVIERDRGDVQATKTVIELLRKQVPEDPSQRTALIDALYVLVEQTEVEAQRVGVLAECAALLDQEPDGGERAADCREQIIGAVSAADPVAQEAIRGLEVWYQRQESHHQLSELYSSVASSGAALEVRVEFWGKLHQLRRGPLDDPDGQREALEALLELQPDEPRWRDLLLEAYLDAGDDVRAGELIDKQIATAETPAQKASLLVNSGKLRLKAGDTAEAEAALTEAVTIDATQPRAWMALQELYEETQQPMKAVDAQIKAAETTDNPVEKSRRFFDAGRTCIEALGIKDRGIGLLEKVVELDPDHREATGMLLDALVESGDLVRAWPIAQTFVLQARSQAAGDIELNLHALSLAGRCALEANERDKAREYLGRAKELDAANLEVVRALADLDMDAGAWEEALKGYQSVALGASGSLGPHDQAELYLRMGKAREGMNEDAKAVQMVERALDIDPDHEPAARHLITLIAENRAAERVRAKTRLADLLDRKASAAEDDEAEAFRDEHIAILREVAETLADDLNRPDEALRHLEQLLEFRPGDQGILHQLLDLYTTQKKWRNATEVLSNLADVQTMDSARAKYLYAGAVLFRDNVGEPTEAAGWMRRVLEADPLHDKAFRASIEMFHEANEWKSLSKVLRERLKALPDDADPEERVLLFDQIGAVYEEKLGDPKTALAAYEQSIALAPGDSDKDRQYERRRKVIELSSDMDDALDKAVEQTMALVQERPMHFDDYHQLVLLFLKQSNKDAAICVARALRFLKQATPKELEVASVGDGAFAQARGTVTRDLWRQCIYHPKENARLSDLFSLVWHVVAAREGQTHAHFGVQRKDRLQVNLQSSGIGRFVAYACQVLDTPVPDYFERNGEAGGFVVGALSAEKMVYPSLMAGDDATGKQAEEAYAFRAGRAVTRVQPEHVLSSVLRSGAALRDAVYAAVAVGQPGVAIPAESKERAGTYAELLKRHLPPARLDNLKSLTARVVEGGGADTKAWIQGVDYTAVRVGFLLSDSLETSARILSQGAAEGSQVPAKELIKDLVSFSVSDGYFRVRKALKMNASK